MASRDQAPLHWLDLWRGAVRACLAIGCGHHDAEDCASEAVAALWRLAGGPTSVENPEAWVIHVAKRRAADQRRRAVVRERATRSLSISETTESPEAGVTDVDLARWLWDTAVRVLPPATVEVLRRSVDGQSNRAIAADLGITARAVENHLFRARRVLRAFAQDPK